MLIYASRMKRFVTPVGIDDREVRLLPKRPTVRRNLRYVEMDEAIDHIVCESFIVNKDMCKHSINQIVKILNHKVEKVVGTISTAELKILKNTPRQYGVNGVSTVIPEKQIDDTHYLLPTGIIVKREVRQEKKYPNAKDTMSSKRGFDMAINGDKKKDKPFSECVQANGDCIIW